MNETLQILEKINSLYTNIMIFFGILVAFVGVIIPIFINWYQSRKLEIEKENLKNDLSKELSSEIELLFKSEEEKFEEKIKKIEQDFKIKSDAISGRIFHVQGSQIFDEKRYGEAMNSYLIASYYLFFGEDYYNLQRANNNMLECIKYVNKNDFESKPQLEQKKNKLIKVLKEHDQKGMFTDFINNLSMEIDKAKKREPETETSSE